MQKLLVGKAGLVALLFAIGVTNVAQAATSALELPPPATWKHIAESLAKLTQTAWASAVSEGRATAAKCQWQRTVYRCQRVTWRVGQVTLKAQSISWHANQTGGPLLIEDGQWQQARFKRYTPKHLKQLRHQNNTVTLHIGTLTLLPAIKLERIRWEKQQRKVAIAQSATEQGQHWTIQQLTRFDVWPNQQHAQLSTKTPTQHLDGWLAPQVLWSQGAGVELQGMYAWPIWFLGLGATINPGHYYTLTAALFSKEAKVDTIPLKLNIGMTQDGSLTYSALGQWRLGDAYRHLDIDAQWTKQTEQWATGRLTTNQLLAPVARTRVGLSASADQATTQLALFEDTTAQNTAIRGMSMVFGTHRALSRRTSLRLNVWHLGTLAQGEQPTLNQSDVQFGLHWQFGQLDRVYLRAQTSGWMSLQVEEVLQGWSATAAGRLTAQAEVGVALTGHFDSIRHDLTPKLLAFEQPLVRVKRDNRIAQPIPAGTRQTWGAYQFQLAQSLHMGNDHHIDFPIGVAWLRHTEHDLLGVARLRYVNDQWEGAVEANLMRYAGQTGWHLHLESPSIRRVTIAYGVGQMNDQQMSLVSLLNNNSMSLQTMLLQQSFQEEAQLEDDATLRHMGRLSWNGQTHALALHGAFATRDWWSSALTHQYRLRAIGWAIRTTGFVLNDKTQTQVGLGFGMMQRFE